MALSSHMRGINFAYPADMRKSHKKLKIQVRTKAIHYSNKHKIQIEPIQFEWDRFLFTLEKDFPERLNEMVSHNRQQQPPNSNKNRFTPNENRKHYNGTIDNRTRTMMPVLQ